MLRCSVLGCGGTFSRQAARDELWARFSTAAPQWTTDERAAVLLQAENGHTPESAFLSAC